MLHAVLLCLPPSAASDLAPSRMLLGLLLPIGFALLLRSLLPKAKLLTSTMKKAFKNFGMLNA